MENTLGFGHESTIGFDPDYKQEDFGEVDLKWYVAPLNKPISIVLAGKRVDVAVAVVDCHNRIMALPATACDAQELVTAHNERVGQGPDSREALVQHIALLQQRINTLVPGRVPSRGPVPKNINAA